MARKVYAEAEAAEVIVSDALFSVFAGSQSSASDALLAKAFEGEPLTLDEQFAVMKHWEQDGQVAGSREQFILRLRAQLGLEVEHRIDAAMEALAQQPLEIQGFVRRSWLCSWKTSRRGQSKCVYGCECDDTAAHYLTCTRAWRMLSEIVAPLSVASSLEDRLLSDFKLIASLCSAYEVLDMIEINDLKCY